VARLLTPRRAFYYYPRRGFGSIAEALCREAQAGGARVRTKVVVSRLEARPGGPCRVDAAWDGERHEIHADAVVSTIPLGRLAALLRPAAPEAVTESARELRWRGIRLLQVLLRTDRALSGGETYYFPEETFVFGRISEPAQYSPQLAPGPGRTLLNVEVICTPGDALWSREEAAFSADVVADAERAGVLRRDEVVETRSVFLPAVYPVYDTAYRDRLEGVLGWIESHGNVYSIGRGGLFLHANADHSIALGLRLARHMAGEGALSRGWRAGLGEELFRVRD
jgi:protoporphyrinogen oxidase